MARGWPRRGAAARLESGTLKTGRERVSLRGDVGSIWYSRDGKRLVTAVGDSKVKMWDAETGEEIASQEGFGESVRSAVFSPDGTHIATASGSLVRITPTFQMPLPWSNMQSRVSRCLTRDQRLRYIGDPVPPDCASRARSGLYATPKWKAWLAAGKSSAPPDTADWYSGRFISPRRD